MKCKKPLKKRIGSFRKGRRVIKKRPADLSIFTVVQQLVSRGLAGSTGAKIHKILGMTTGIYNKSATIGCRTLIKDLPKVR